jgi:hypothetical protein
MPRKSRGKLTLKGKGSVKSRVESLFSSFKKNLKSMRSKSLKPGTKKYSHGGKMEGTGKFRGQQN